MAPERAEWRRAIRASAKARGAGHGGSVFLQHQPTARDLPGPSPHTATATNTHEKTNPRARSVKCDEGPLPNTLGGNRYLVRGRTVSQRNIRPCSDPTHLQQRARDWYRTMVQGTRYLLCAGLDRAGQGWGAGPNPRASASVLVAAPVPEPVSYRHADCGRNASDGVRREVRCVR